ncbi:hypothetical protein GCM10011507_25080 [Edaphobacter acidisoli]|uniref:Zinc-finger domain-containing protein n=1 Tax=Edaphobacter acidisoli TaxID=2040573 RepID=A0A916RYH9_9BACT|nr:hypothetical protein [Edaphobacter acidisoli]GGA72433.1 hypothetical protein GCM10011507_25080 [Edaphobacter acidisoli]
MRRCERDREVAAALRGGGLSAELSGHVAECAGCRETVRVTRALLAVRAVEPPDAGVVWRRVQEEVLLRRATRPLAVMRVLSAVFLGVLAVWAVPVMWVLVRGHLGDLGPEWVTGTVVSAVMIGVGVLGLWYVGRRTPSPVLKY